MTKSTCADSGHWLGDVTSPMVTVIDTPGFGENFTAEVSYIEEMVAKFKDDFKYINVFILVFQQGGRLSGALHDMLFLFEKMFGAEFWKNTILLASKWHFFDKEVSI